MPNQEQEGDPQVDLSAISVKLELKALIIEIWSRDINNNDNNNNTDHMRSDTSRTLSRTVGLACRFKQLRYALLMQNEERGRRRQRY
jgi:hypothetical protein